jgi:hypothetical protein
MRAAFPDLRREPAKQNIDREARLIAIMSFSAVMLLLVIQAGWRGGAPERLAAGSMAIAALATGYTSFDDEMTFICVQWDVFWIDAGLLCVLMLIALAADRFWPLWLSAFQLLAVAAHAARGYGPDILPFAYWWLVGKASYPMIGLVCIGIERHWRRERKSGPEYAWSRQRWHADAQRRQMKLAHDAASQTSSL